MFEEFQKQKHSQADNNKDMAKIIQEQQSKPLKVHHVQKEQPVKLNNNLMEEFNQRQKSKQQSKPKEEGKNTLDEMKIEPSKEREDNEYFHQDKYQEEKKKQMPHYSNVLNRELGEKPQQKIYREKLMPSVPYHKYITSHVRSQRMAQEQQQDEQEEQRFQNLKRQLTENMHEKEEEAEVQVEQAPQSKGRVVDYRIKGHKYAMQQMNDKSLRSEILNNGFHVVNVNIERDPVNNQINGIYKARLRLNDKNMDLFEDYLKYKNCMILFKKIL